MERNKITFIAGNGYDLSLGMKTSYKLFYDYLVRKGFFIKYEVNAVIRYIKEKEDRTHWYAFENDILDYASKSEKSIILKQCNQLLDIINAIEVGELGTINNIARFSSLAKHLDIDKSLFAEPLDDLLLMREKLLPVFEDTKNIIQKYQEDCQSEAKQAIYLLRNELNDFLCQAHPSWADEYKYPSAISVLSAALGMNWISFNEIRQGFKQRYDRNKSTFDLGNVQIVSFNYTNLIFNTLRSLSRLGDHPLTIYKSNSEPPVYYIHNTLNTDLVFGANANKYIPAEYTCLTKRYQLIEDSKSRFSKILNESRVVIIYGQSVDGIDFDYYQTFLENIPEYTDVYVFDANKERIDKCRYVLSKNLNNTPTINFVNSSVLEEMELALNRIKQFSQYGRPL